MAQFYWTLLRQTRARARYIIHNPRVYIAYRKVKDEEAKNHMDDSVTILTTASIALYLSLPSFSSTLEQTEQLRNCPKT